MYDVNLALFRKLCEPACQLADNVVFPVSQFPRVDLRIAKRHTVLGHRRGIVNDFRRMQQGFRRNASYIEAYTANHVITFYQYDVEPQIRGTKCRRVAART